MSPLLPILGLAAAAFFVLRKPSPPAQSPEDAANDAYLGMATAHAYLRQELGDTAAHSLAIAVAMLTTEVTHLKAAIERLTGGE